MVRKEVSLEIRKLIIDLRKNGKSYMDIVKITNKPKSTVRNIIKHFEKYNTIENCVRSGRPVILSERENRWIIKEIKKNPKLSAPFLCEELKDRFGKVVSCQTIRNVLKKSGYHGRVMRKKPFLSKKNIKERLLFAAKYINKPISFWNEVIFADETKINMFGSDGERYVWRETGKAYEMKNTLPTVKHGGDSQMIWGCMAAGGVGNLHFIDCKMDKTVYLNILKDNLKQSAENLGLLNRFKFYQDNDPKHTSDICRLWALYNCPQVIKTPPQSPDLNPIEHLWRHVKRKIHKNQLLSTGRNKNSKATLKERISRVWNNISPEICQKLVSSMPSRLRQVIKNRGGPTKY